MPFDHVRTPLVWLRPGAAAPSHIEAGMYGAWRRNEYWLDHWFTGTMQPAGGSPFAPNGVIAHQMGLGFPNARHYGIALAYHRSAEVASWIDPTADFDLALNSGDDVELDRVFQRAHLLHRWDLLKDWYPLTWYKRLTCTPKLAAAPLELSKSVPTGTGVYPYWQYPAPAQVDRWIAGLWWTSGGDVGLGLGGAGTKWIDNLVDVPTTALEPEWSHNGLTPERMAPLANFAHTWQPYASNVLIQQEVSFAQAKDHLWTPNAANEVFDLVGFPIFPGIAKLEQLAAEATALMQSPQWQTKAFAWHTNYQQWCAPFGLPNPPTWYGAHVAYRPFWWRLDVADVLAGNTNPWADAFVVDPFDFDYEAKKAEDWATTDAWEIVGQLFAFTVGAIVLGGFVGAAFGAVGAGGLGATVEGVVGTGLQSGLNSEITGGTFADGFESGIEGALEGVVGDVAGGELDLDIGGDMFDDFNDFWNNNINPLLGTIGGAIDGIQGIAGHIDGPSSGGQFGTPGLHLDEEAAEQSGGLVGSDNTNALLVALGVVLAVVFIK